MSLLPAHLRFGVHGIRGFATGEFDLDPDGPKAVVLNIAGPRGEPRDLCAWFPNDPWRWWLRFRTAAILGEAMVERAEYLGCPLTVYSTPQQWLFARGRGACVLRWNIELTLHLGGINHIVADSPALAARINSGLGRGQRIASVLQPARASHVA
jgi:hypothetical protein